MSKQQSHKARRFTGYHAAAILCAFFAVIIAVNFTMATFAISTFGGTVVDNSYVASQKYNGWLEEARQEKELGWKVAKPVREEGRLLFSIEDALGQPMASANITATAEHPLGREPVQTLSFAEASPGQYRSIEPLPAGRWKLRTRIMRDGRERDLTFEIQ